MSLKSISSDYINNLKAYRSLGQETDRVAADSGHVDVARCAPRSVQGFARFPNRRFSNESSRSRNVLFPAGR